MYIQVVHPNRPYSTTKHTQIIIEDDVTAMPVQIDNEWVEVFHIPDCVTLKEAFTLSAQGHGEGKKEFVNIKGNRVNLFCFKSKEIMTNHKNCTIRDFKDELPVNQIEVTGEHYRIITTPMITNRLGIDVLKGYYHRIVFMNNFEGGYVFSRPSRKQEKYHLPFSRNVHIINKTSQKTFLDGF